jgi:hypothetical protein
VRKREYWIPQSLLGYLLHPERQKWSGKGGGEGRGFGSVFS